MFSSILQDLRLKRPALGKTAYKVRARSVLRAKKTQNIAANYFMKLTSVCKLVIKSKGEAIKC